MPTPSSSPAWARCRTSTPTTTARATVPAAVADLRAAAVGADALLVCTPEYAGALPGSFKNLLEWMVGGGEAYRKPIAWINVAGPAAPTGAADAHASLPRSSDT